MRRRPSAIAIPVLLLAACASAPPPPPDPDTLAVFSQRRITITPEELTGAGPDHALTAYREFVDGARGESAARATILRRLADLEIAAAVAEQTAAPNAKTWQPRFARAIERYREVMRANASDADNEHIWYQLAHAYYAIGKWSESLAALDRIVTRNPDSPYRDDVQLRRGEAHFKLHDYARAESAYAGLVAHGATSRYYERALYMHGWSLFKQARYPEALQSYFALLDLRRGGQDTRAATLHPFARHADAELLADVYRIVAVALARLSGPTAIPGHADPAIRRPYEFQVYRALVDLYLRQGRAHDAASAYHDFVRRYPNHEEGPPLLAKVVDGYSAAGLATLALEAKAEFATRYGVDTDYRRAHPTADHAQLAPSLRPYLADLARNAHAAAQKNKAPSHYDTAIKWYRAYVQAFPREAPTSAINFLLAEALSAHKQVDAAIIEYEKTAYDYPYHPKAADAGYAALVLYNQRLKEAPNPGLRGRAIESALRFGNDHASDARVGPVLTEAAERLYAHGDPERATVTARRVLALKPPVSAELRRVVWTIVAHVEFDRAAFALAERAYQEALTVTPANHANRTVLTERLASSIYKQGEHARLRSDWREAKRQFLRVGTVAPASPIRTMADYDAATSALALKEWAEAVRLLENFRSRYPGHTLQIEIAGKLATAHFESGAYAFAATEFERVMRTQPDAKQVREATWRAADSFERAGRAADAAGLYERYVKNYPHPLANATEGRYRLAVIARERQAIAQSHAWLQAIIDADAAGGSERTDRTRYLAADATLTLAEPAYNSYRQARLVEPFKQSLAVKKERMTRALGAYEQALRYGIAEITTAATWRIGDIYQDFAKALLDSPRPPNLKADALDQYNVMLEEQAYPFEQKSMEFHETNARRARTGLYDEWVKRSYTSLRALRPARYLRDEKYEAVFHGMD